MLHVCTVTITLPVCYALHFSHTDKEVDDASVSQNLSTTT